MGSLDTSLGLKVLGAIKRNEEHEFINKRYLTYSKTIKHIKNQNMSYNENLFNQINESYIEYLVEGNEDFKNISEKEDKE